MMNINDAVLQTERDVPPGSPTGSKDTLGKSQEGWNIFIKYNKFLLLLTVFHYQTKSYSGHKISDEFSNSLRDAIDKFLETYQGKFGRIQTDNDMSIQLSNLSDTTKLIKYSKHMYEITSKLKKYLSEHEDLGAILDDIAGQINKLVYLLTLE